MASTKKNETTIVVEPDSHKSLVVVQPNEGFDLDAAEAVATILRRNLEGNDIGTLTVRPVSRVRWAKDVPYAFEARVRISGSDLSARYLEAVLREGLKSLRNRRNSQNELLPLDLHGGDSGFVLDEVEYVDAQKKAAYDEERRQADETAALMNRAHLVQRQRDRGREDYRTWLPVGAR